MIISFTNVIGAIRNVGKSIITDGLKMWLGFKTSEISGDNQITPDKSGNSNVGKLYTGTSLNFNTADAQSIQIDSFQMSGSNATFAFWINPDLTTGSRTIFDVNSTRFIIRINSGNLQIFSDTGSYVTFGSIASDEWQRFVIVINGTSASAYVNGVQSGVTQTILPIDMSTATQSRIGANFTGAGTLDAKLSDFQIYNAVWSADDIAYDYAKPNHLVTDNTSTSLTVTNLKAYWALSEGAGLVAYDSGTPTDNGGLINVPTWNLSQPRIPQLGMMDFAISTPVSDEVTLVSNPSNPSQDILGNSVRLREHSFNLNGSGYSDVADNASLDFGTGAFSCDGWVKFKHVNTNSINCIYSNGGQIDAASNFGIGVTSNKIVARVSSTALSSSTTFSEGEWVYFALTRDGSGACKLYINDDTTPQGTASDAGSVSNSLEKRIGRDSSAVRFYQNLIDDVRVYNIELTSDEINNNYNAGLSAHSAGSSFSDDFSGDYGN